MVSRPVDCQAPEVAGHRPCSLALTAVTRRFPLGLTQPLATSAARLKPRFAGITIANPIDIVTLPQSSVVSSTTGSFAKPSVISRMSLFRSPLSIALRQLRTPSALAPVSFRASSHPWPPSRPLSPSHTRSLYHSPKMTTEATVRTFFSSSNFAVVGASSNPAKYGHKGSAPLPPFSLTAVPVCLFPPQSSPGTPRTPSQ